LCLQFFGDIEANAPLYNVRIYMPIGNFDVRGKNFDVIIVLK